MSPGGFLTMSSIDSSSTFSIVVPHISCSKMVPVSEEDRVDEVQVVCLV